MDPVTIITSVLAISGAVLKSYERISSVVASIRHAPRELESLQNRSACINTIVENLKQALEENSICEVVKRDELALKHVTALDEPLKSAKATLDEVVHKLYREYKLGSDGSTYKVRWQFYFSNSDWEVLQKRLRDHMEVLGTSMQGLNTLQVLRMLGNPTEPTKDPAKTLRTYASSVYSSETAQAPIGMPVPSSLLKSSNISPTPSLDDRRQLARKKVLLQRDLLQAAKNGDHLDVSIILGEGVEADWIEEGEGMTALHYAARYGRLRVAELLLNAGADIEAKSDAFGDEWSVRVEKNRTPLIWAAAGKDCSRTQERMCRLLLDNGADVNARNISSRTALQEAAMSVRHHGLDTRPTIKLLLDRGAFINAFDIHGWTALHECAHYGDESSTRLILDRGGEVSGRPGPDDPATASNPDLGGPFEPHTTPLDACTAWSWNGEVIDLLIERGADMHAKSGHGTSAWERAQAEGKEDLFHERSGTLEESRQSLT